MSRFATLDSLKKKAAKEEENEEEEDDGQEFYAGGAGRDGGSGLAVVGPPSGRRRDGGGGAPVEDIFERAAEGPPAESGEGGTIHRRITMYREGFTVDDGPFRRLDDPANAEFLQDLAKGIVPREIAVPLPGQSTEGPIHVGLVDRRKEDYVPPPAPAYVAFGGEGQTMGGTSSVASSAVVSADAGGAIEMPVVDSTQPATTLQVRLHDGNRIRAQLNHTHTVRHIQAIIQSHGAGSSPYTLSAGFPPAPITDYSQTLKEANLIGAQITQKLV